jgi:hypothetical protein
MADPKRPGSTKPPPAEQTEVAVPRTKSAEFAFGVGQETGEHLKVSLDSINTKMESQRQKQEEHSRKLDEAIRVDREDHADMRGDNGKIRDEIKILGNSVTTTNDKVDGLIDNSKLVNLTLGVIATQMGIEGRIDEARKKAEIDVAADAKKRRWGVFYNWLERAGVGVIAAVFALLAAGHHC